MARYGLDLMLRVIPLLACVLLGALVSPEATAQPQPQRRGGDTLRPSPVDTTRYPSWEEEAVSQSGYLGEPGSMERLLETIRRDSASLRAFMDSLAGTPQAIMRRNLAMNYSDWKPSPADKARRDEEIWRSQSMDKIHQNIPRVGVSMSMGDIARALGLAEDVTPRIKYTLMRTDSVSVRVYDLTTKLVRVIVSGPQSPGVYSFDWDMLDDTGRKVVAGDYIAEVVVQRRLLLRKRIEVP